MVESSAPNDPLTSQSVAASGADDWTMKAADFVIDTVDQVKSKTTKPAIYATRGVVYGLVLMALLPALLVLSVAILIRMLDAYLPIGAGVGSATWAAHLVVGLIFSLLGIGFWQARTATNPTRPIIITAVIALIIVVIIVTGGVVSGF